MRTDMLLAAGLAGALALGAAPGSAKDRLERAMEERVRTSLPASWQVRVRWRETVLVTYLMPPTHEAFDLFYQPARQTELIQRLCPPLSDGLWGEIGDGRDIAIEPAVLGKAGFRVSCRATAAEAEAS